MLGVHHMHAHTHRTLARAHVFNQRHRLDKPAAATLTMAVFPAPDGPQSKSSRCPALLPRWRCERLSSIHSFSSLTLSLCTAKSADALGANRSAHTSLPGSPLPELAGWMAGALHMHM